MSEKNLSKSDGELLKSALLKKAYGFDLEEVTEEYVESEGEERLLKRKVTRKNVPPDIVAIKMLIDANGGDSICSLTDEELETEKQRLLNLLNNAELNGNIKE